MVIWQANDLVTFIPIDQFPVTLGIFAYQSICIGAHVNLSTRINEVITTENVIHSIEIDVVTLVGRVLLSRGTSLVTALKDAGN